MCLPEFFMQFFIFSPCFYTFHMNMTTSFMHSVNILWCFAKKYTKTVGFYSHFLYYMTHGWTYYFFVI